MISTDFNSLNPPYFYLLVGAPDTLGQYAYRLNYELGSQLAVRVVRGSRMRRVDDLFGEFSAALQFPYYFGNNWAAFDECLADLDWLPAKGYILIISEASTLLSEARADRATFIRILANVCKYWATERTTVLPSKEFKPLPFHVLFQCEESAVESLLELLSPESLHTPVIALRQMQGAC